MRYFITKTIILICFISGCSNAPQPPEPKGELTLIFDTISTEQNQKGE